MVSDKFSGSTSTFRGKEAWDRVILNPGTSPPALSCQPPPVVNICSTIITAWMSESKLAVRSVTRSNAARIAPAKMLLVPKPLPWGAVDHVWSSNPAWYFLCSWALNGSLEGSVTMSRKQKQALRRAPKEESAIKRTLYYNQELSSFSWRKKILAVSQRPKSRLYGKNLSRVDGSSAYPRYSFTLGAPTFHTFCYKTKSWLG